MLCEFTNDLKEGISNVKRKNSYMLDDRNGPSVAIPISTSGVETKYDILNQKSSNQLCAVVTQDKSESKTNQSVDFKVDIPNSLQGLSSPKKSKKRMIGGMLCEKSNRDLQKHPSKKKLKSKQSRYAKSVCNLDKADEEDDDEKKEFDIVKVLEEIEVKKVDLFQKLDNLEEKGLMLKCITDDDLKNEWINRKSKNFIAFDSKDLKQLSARISAKNLQKSSARISAKDLQKLSARISTKDLQKISARISKNNEPTEQAPANSPIKKIDVLQKSISDTVETPSLIKKKQLKGLSNISSNEPIHVNDRSNTGQNRISKVFTFPSETIHNNKDTSHGCPNSPDQINEYKGQFYISDSFMKQMDLFFTMENKDEYFSFFTNQNLDTLVESAFKERDKLTSIVELLNIYIKFSLYYLSLSDRICDPKKSLYGYQKNLKECTLVSTLLNKEFNVAKETKQLTDLMYRLVRDKKERDLYLKLFKEAEKKRGLESIDIISSKFEIENSPKIMKSGFFGNLENPINFNGGKTDTRYGSTGSLALGPLERKKSTKGVDLSGFCVSGSNLSKNKKFSFILPTDSIKGQNPSTTNQEQCIF